MTLRELLDALRRIRPTARESREFIRDSIPPCKLAHGSTATCAECAGWHLDDTDKEA